MIILYFYGLLYGLIIIGITFMLFQNITHICPNCYSEISNKSFYPISSKGTYVTITYGKCIIVIKKIYIYILILIIIIFGIVINYNYYIQINSSENPNEKIINDQKSEEFISKLYNKNDTLLTWEIFINDCGSKVMVENSAKANEIFKRKYYKKQIKWEGYFISAFVKSIVPGVLDYNHLVNLNIRMIPSETIKQQDLILSLNKDNYDKYFKTLQLLKTGSPIQFEAIFEEIGDEWSPHHLHLVDIKLIDDFITNKEKVILFKGINFNIEGHMKIQKEVNEVIENKINETEKELNLTLENEDENNQKNNLTNNNDNIDNNNQNNTNENNNINANNNNDNINQENENKNDLNGNNTNTINNNENNTEINLNKNNKTENN